MQFSKLERLFLSAFVFFSMVMFSHAKNKVIVIGIDGCMPSALLSANTPTVDSLLQNATVSWDALTIPPTVSGPCWSSMLTGVWHDKHGVTNNQFTNSHYDIYPPFFKRIKDYNEKLKIASVVNWGPINDKIVDFVDYKATASSDEAVARLVADSVLTGPVDCIFIQFDQVDGAGHGNGYGPDIPEYIRQIERTDSYIKILMNAINKRTTRNEENWLVILSSDHGGMGHGHGGASLEERNIVFIVSGESVIKQQMSRKDTVIPAPQKSVRFDGSTTYVRIENQAPFKFGTNQDFTIECLVKAKEWTQDPAIISNKNWQSGRNPGFVMSCTSDGGWKVNVGDGTDRVDISGGRINDDTWHHLVATFDRNGLMSIFHDGELAGSKAMAQIGNLDSPFEFVIGQDGTKNYPHFYKGLLAEIRVWDTVLSKDDVKNGFAKPVDSDHPKYSHLIAYWKIDDGAGKVLADFSSNHNNGELVGGNFSWSTTSDSFRIADYSGTPKIVDVPVTAMAHLGVNISPTWNLDGQAVGLTPATFIVSKQSVNEMDYQLTQNYPNPFNPSTTIQFTIPVAGNADLKVFNILGEAVYSVGNKFYPAGSNAIQINTQNWPSGIYMYQVKYGQQAKMKKCMLIK